MPIIELFDFKNCTPHEMYYGEHWAHSNIAEISAEDCESFLKKIADQNNIDCTNLATIYIGNLLISASNVVAFKIQNNANEPVPAPCFLKLRRFINGLETTVTFQISEKTFKAIYSKIGKTTSKHYLLTSEISFLAESFISMGYNKKDIV